MKTSLSLRHKILTALSSSFQLIHTICRLNHSSRFYCCIHITFANLDSYDICLFIMGSFFKLILLEIQSCCMFFLFFFLNRFYLFIYFWLRWVFVAVHGLFSSCVQRGLLFVAVRRLLLVMASLVAAHGLQVCGLQQLWHQSSVVVVRGPSCSMAYGFFLDQGLNPCPLHWQADS